MILEKAPVMVHVLYHTARSFNELKQRSLTVSAPVCFDYFNNQTYLQRVAHQLFARIQSRIIIPAIRAFPLSQVTEAHSRIESRQTMGAVVLTAEK